MIRVTLAAIAALLIASCATDDSVGEGTPPPGEFLVPVTLTEHEIDLPDTAPAGEVTFELDNQGDQAHSFVISGSGDIEDVEERFTGEVMPGATQTFTVQLEPGTYTVWCPIGDHRERGMEAEIQITEATQTDVEAPLGDDAVFPSDQQEELDDD